MRTWASLLIWIAAGIGVGATVNFVDPGGNNLVLTLEVLAGQDPGPLPPVPVLPTIDLPTPAEAPQTPLPPRDDKYKDDPMAFCRKGPPMEGETSAHECHCTLVCSGDVKTEKPECELYCTKERCRCYPDDPCKLPPELK